MVFKLEFIGGSIISYFGKSIKAKPCVFNEIVLCTVKSSLRSDEIFGVPPQMKLNPPLYPDEVGFHREAVSSHASGISSAIGGFS